MVERAEAIDSHWGKALHSSDSFKKGERPSTVGNYLSITRQPPPGTALHSKSLT
jgi:hypothetical protein